MTDVDRAVERYETEPITVSRGAEIAGVRTEEFLEILKNRGVQPRYGPESVEDLYSGSDLCNGPDGDSND